MNITSKSLTVSVDDLVSHPWLTQSTASSNRQSVLMEQLKNPPVSDEFVPVVQLDDSGTMTVIRNWDLVEVIRWRITTGGFGQSPEIKVSLVPNSQAIAIKYAIFQTSQDIGAQDYDLASMCKHVKDTLKCTDQYLAEAAGKSRSWITKLLGTLKLTPSLMALYRTERLALSSARILYTASFELQDEIAKNIRMNSWGWDEIRNAISGKNSQHQKNRSSLQVSPSPPNEEKDIHTRNLEDALSARIGSPVNIGRGEISFDFYSLSELSGGIQHLKHGFRAISTESKCTITLHFNRDFEVLHQFTGHLIEE